MRRPIRECFDIKHQGDDGDITTVLVDPELQLEMQIMASICNLINIILINYIINI